ncbi:hypothetical protein OESDEN_21990 [Oesophagostomum dentatum]|uniref:Uncharacterized protein n=1 Tax=Oesophagostomum dentatum TaxID=61180 RepID=A0A0B1S0B7_OESDE|nr:hypothetical protein OESDEN_21990 [Oesophagostomum dentatum]
MLAFQSDTDSSHKRGVGQQREKSLDLARNPASPTQSFDARRLAARRCRARQSQRICLEARTRDPKSGRGTGPPSSDRAPIRYGGQEHLSSS